jgi:short-subunit dehydrogenase
MSKRTWIIIGATSVIAEQFAHLAAQVNHNLRLVGRDTDQLHIIAADISLRYKVTCEVIVISYPDAAEYLTKIFKPCAYEFDLFIAHSDFTINADLTTDSITRLIEVNILASSLFIHSYLACQQQKHNIIYLSSVAAAVGRPKNSLYGASKAVIELFLQGLQKGSDKSKKSIIVRLGFIDTRQTYGVPGVFYAADPSD